MFRARFGVSKIFPDEKNVDRVSLFSQVTRVILIIIFDQLYSGLLDNKVKLTLIFNYLDVGITRSVPCWLSQISKHMAKFPRTREDVKQNLTKDVSFETSIECLSSLSSKPWHLDNEVKSDISVPAHSPAIGQYEN